MEPRTANEPTPLDADPLLIEGEAAPVIHSDPTPTESKRCQYGPNWPHMICGRVAVTKRLTPAGNTSWDVCEDHAAFLDRLRANVKKHAELLRKLADS